MTSIYHVLLQSIHISIIAGVLLVIKNILKDKLSPRWQYNVWFIFLISLFIPAGYFHLYIFPKMNIYIETIKVIIEKILNSNYIHEYEIIRSSSVFPLINQLPVSITDFLFVIYIAGCIFIVIRYFYNYIELRLSLRKTEFPDKDTLLQIDNVREKYNLKKCMVVTIDQLTSPFVFGVIKPILVIPKEQSVDDKVILHELLHLKYYDSLQSMIWSILKTMHWFNPFISYVFKNIHNDMESLCDQRVLELLEGEERRDYGRILLSMVNDKYPYSFGTTSLSNGNVFIKKRIEAITRFKVYPKGMTIVSICIVILLLPFVFGGTVNSEWINAIGSGTFAEELEISSARLLTCSTQAGAIDTFVKGLLTQNKQYLVTTMTKEKQLNYKLELIRLYEINTDLNRGQYHYISYAGKYRVIGLEKVNNYEYLSNILLYDQEEIEENGEIKLEYTYLLIPIRLVKEEGWKVDTNGEAVVFNTKEYLHSFIENRFIYDEFSHEFADGKINVSVDSLMIIPKVVYEDSYSFIGNNEYNVSMEALPDNEFDNSYRKIDISYQVKNNDYNEILIFGMELNDLDEEIDYSYLFDEAIGYQKDTSGSILYNNRCSEWNHKFKKSIKDNTIELSCSFHDGNISEDNSLNCYSVLVFIDNQLVEDYRFKVGESYE